MRRFAVLLSVVAMLLIGALALRAQPSALAQDATPSADMEIEGATFEPIGFAQGVTLPSTADLLAARFSLDPGAGFPLEPSDPTGAMVVVESGAVTGRVEEMVWTISRGGAMQAMMATPAAEPDMSGLMEEVAIGEEATLQTGDVAFIPGNVSGEVRNAGQERAEGIVFLIVPSEAMSSATPEP
jgi:quercetin dioxygenase-like cupin family protein